MNLRPDQNQALAQHFNKMHPEMFKSYINNPETGSQLKAWMQANNYQHPGMMQSNNVSPAVSAPVTSNLGMSENHIGSYGPNKPSYLHFDPKGYQGSGKIPFPHKQVYGERIPHPNPLTQQQVDLSNIQAQPHLQDFAIGRQAGTNILGGSAPQHTSSGMIDPTFSAGASASQSASEQAVAESIAKSGTESAGASGLSGPQAFFANMALEAIPTRDRNKVNTPFGDQGSVPGILKGAGKGALLGSTIDTATGGATGGLGAIGGAIIGGVSGAQGTFDSTSPRQVIASSIRRPRGGLLQVPKGLYG